MMGVKTSTFVARRLHLETLIRVYGKFISTAFKTKYLSTVLQRLFRLKKKKNPQTYFRSMLHTQTHTKHPSVCFQPQLLLLRVHAKQQSIS